MNNKEEELHDTQEFNISAQSLVVRVDIATTLQQQIDHAITAIQSANKSTTVLISNIRVLLSPGSTYIGDVRLEYDNMSFLTDPEHGLVTTPGSILGSIFVQDVVGARFLNIHIAHPKKRIAVHITNPTINQTDPTLITECKIQGCSIVGSVVVTNHGSHVQLSSTRITDARGLPGLLVEDGGEAIVRANCEIQRCKLPILTRSRKTTKHISTVHILTNDLVIEHNQAPNLQDDGGVIVVYVSVLEQLCFAKTTASVQTIYSVLHQMSQARAVSPTGEKWCRKSFVQRIQNLKEDLGFQWTRDLGKEFGKVLQHVDMLLGLERVQKD